MTGRSRQRRYVDERVHSGKRRWRRSAGVRTNELPREVTRQADVEQDAQRQVDDDARHLYARTPGWTQPLLASLLGKARIDDAKGSSRDARGS